MTVERYFLVTHRYNGNRYRAKAPSKNKLRAWLPRFDVVVGYHSFWDLEEVDSKKYNRMKHLKDAPVFQKEYKE